MLIDMYACMYDMYVGVIEKRDSSLLSHSGTPVAHTTGAKGRINGGTQIEAKAGASAVPILCLASGCRIGIARIKHIRLRPFA